MAEIDIIVYGTDWCGDCRRSKKFLDSNQITYRWINIDLDKKSEEVVLALNHGIRSVPTIVFPDGTVLVEPPNSLLADKLNIPS